MSNHTDDIRDALNQAAIQAEHYPPGHADYWGRKLNGDWTITPESVAEYG